MRRFIFGSALFFFFALAVRSQTQPPSSFVDNFDQPVLNSAWQVHPGDGQISLTANPGFLRYELGAPQFNSNATDDTNSLWVFRQFSGDSWTLETRVTYSLPLTENGRQMLLRVPFPDTSGRNINEIRWWRDVDCCGPRNRIVIDFTDNGQLSTGAILSPNPADTYVIRIIRKQQAVEVQVSSDGTTFTSVAQHSYATPLPGLQDVVLSSANFCCTGYADYDYVTVSGSSVSSVYVTNFKSNTVSVFDSSTNTLVSTIPVGTNPVGVVLRPDGAFAYVANQTYPGTVSVINTQSNTVIATIPVGPFPTGMAITPNGRFVYAVDSTSPGAVSVIDTTANSVVATIPEGVFPNWVAISPDGMLAYVTNAFSTPAYISVISTATNTEVATIPVGQQPTGIAITPNGAFAYVADGYGSADSVYVIDLGTNTVVSTIPVGVNPGRVSITRDGAFAYVSNFNSGSVSVIDTRTNRVATTVPVGIGPLDIAFTSDGLLAYVANSDFFGGQGNISVIGTLGRTVVATLASGNVPDGAAATPPQSASTGCVFSLSPPTQVIGPQGGLGSFVINAAAGCLWQLAVSASWITILNPAAFPGGGALSGSGSRKVFYTVSSDGGAARSGTITVGSLVFRVDQQGVAPTCSFSISPSHGTFASTGGNLTVVVTVPAGTACAWIATSNAPWLTVVSGASGSGSGTVTLHASPNPGALRTGTAIIAGQVFSATQPAAGVMACGALDVTSQVAVNESGFNWIWLTNFDYSQTITVRNTSSSVIHGPVYLVTVGEPTNYGFGSDSGLLGGGLETHCFSSTGDYLILLLPTGDVQPGQAVGTDLVWFEQSGSLMPRYSTRVLSGTPTK